MKQPKLSPQALENIQLELWENANFNPDIFKIVEKIAQKTSTTKPVPNVNIQDVLFHLTTIRNRNLITSAQQTKLKNTTVAFFGMSVGSQAALTWMLQSRADNIIISDPDTISASNLNRLPFGPESIGQPKVNVVKNRLIQINPSCQVHAYSSKSIEVLDQVFTQKPKPDFIIDAMDDIKAKIHLRKLAHKLKLPLASAADVGDNVMLDIERYDQKPTPQMFHGRVKNIDHIDFDNLSSHEKLKIIIKIIGYEQHSETMLQSLLDIGKKVITWPQLGATATLAGGIVTTTIKKIILGEKVTTGRYYISLDEILVKDYNSKPNQQKRENLIKQLEKI